MKINIKSFWEKQEKEFERVGPYTEIPPELERKQKLEKVNPIREIPPEMQKKRCNVKK
ncbi:hypothetical protein AALA13_05750 [Lachnospiraceae bacterium 50-23]